MCFQYPGPRCSYHAHKEYLVALKAYELAISANDKIIKGDILEEKRDIYYTTPRGQNFLRREADRSEGLDRDNWLLLLEQATKTREVQLEAYQAGLLRKDTSWKEELSDRGSKLTKYGNATGVTSFYLLDKYPDLHFEVKNDDTIYIPGQGKILVLPHKYQHKYDNAVLNGDKYVSSSDELSMLLNDSSNTRDLRADQMKVFTSLWVGKLSDEGYFAVASVNLFTQDVLLINLEDVFQVYTARLKKSKRLGGTAAYTGMLEQVRQQIVGTPFEKGEVIYSEKLKRTLIVGIPLQAEKDKHQGSFYFGYRKAGVEEYYEVRRKHESFNYDVNLMLKASKVVNRNMMSNDLHKKLMEAEQVNPVQTSINS